MVGEPTFSLPADFQGREDSPLDLGLARRVALRLVDRVSVPWSPRKSNTLGIGFFPGCIRQAQDRTVVFTRYVYHLRLNDRCRLGWVRQDQNDPRPPWSLGPTWYCTYSAARAAHCLRSKRPPRAYPARRCFGSRLGFLQEHHIGIGVAAQDAKLLAIRRPVK